MTLAVMDIYEALRNAKDDDERARVIARAIESIGEEVNRRIPAHPATREDLHLTEQALREDIHETEQNLREEIHLAELRLRKEIEQLRKETQENIEQLRRETQENIEQLRKDDARKH